MTTPLAGTVAIVKVCATENGTFVAVGSIRDISATGAYAAQLADITQQGDAAARKMSSGYYDFSLSISGYYHPSDAGQTILMGNPIVWIQYLPDGTTGKKCQCAVEDLKIDHKAGPDAAGLSLTLRSAGGAAPTTV